MKTNYSKFLQSKIFLIEQQAMRNINCEDIEKLRVAIKEIQEICAASVEGVSQRLDREIDILTQENAKYN